MLSIQGRHGSGTVARITIEIVKKHPNQVGFAVQLLRRAVEHFLAGIGRNRRLSNDFEATVAGARTFLYAASVILLARRLAYAL